MDNDYDITVRYLNTDLLLTAPVDLASLVSALTAEHLPDPQIICLSVGYREGIGYQAHVEAFDLAGNYPTPENTIRALLDAIEQLSGSLRSVWEACCRKTVDIGYQSGFTPRHVIHHLSLQTLARMQSLGIDLSVTVYPVFQPGAPFRKH